MSLASLALIGLPDYTDLVITISRQVVNLSVGLILMSILALASLPIKHKPKVIMPIDEQFYSYL